MRQRADRVAAALCGVGAVALLVSTFLDWYPASELEGAYFDRSVGAPAYVGKFSDEGGVSAWQAFAVVDVALALCAVVALGASLLLVRRASARVAAGLATAAAVVGLVLVLWRTVDGPDGVLSGLGLGVDLGPVVAAAALTAIGAGGLIALTATPPDSRAAR